MTHTCCVFPRSTWCRKGSLCVNRTQVMLVVRCLLGNKCISFHSPFFLPYYLHFLPPYPLILSFTHLHHLASLLSPHLLLISLLSSSYSLSRMSLTCLLHYSHLFPKSLGHLLFSYSTFLIGDRTKTLISLNLLCFFSLSFPPTPHVMLCLLQSLLSLLRSLLLSFSTCYLSHFLHFSFLLAVQYHFLHSAPSLLWLPIFFHL